MVLTGKLEKEVEIQSSAEAFFKVWSKQAHQVHEAASGIHGVDVHEGDWETPGSVKEWKYSMDGGKTIETYRERIHVDDDKKLIVLEAIEGATVLERLKSYKACFHAFPKEKGALVKAYVEYEKYNENDPLPERESEFVVELVKDIDAHLCKEK